MRRDPPGSRVLATIRGQAVPEDGHDWRDIGYGLQGHWQCAACGTILDPLMLSLDDLMWVGLELCPMRKPPTPRPLPPPLREQPAFRARRSRRQRYAHAR